MELLIEGVAAKRQQEISSETYHLHGPSALRSRQPLSTDPLRSKAFFTRFIVALIMAASFERLEYRLRALFHSLSHPSFSPSVRLTLPPLSILKILPFPSEPQALPPPTYDASFARPFNISSDVYNNALSIWIPTIIASVYAIGALYWNTLNRKRDNKPWSFSKTNNFYLLVLLHNSLLAGYSAWTFIGMLNAFTHTWPGWEGEHKLPKIVDSLCKIHGPRGYGSAATFNTDKQAWSFTDRTMKLDQGLPDTTDVGRLWNEGLAFYGWLFYLSKFYEIFDTALILIKGKNTTLMQVFHHAGAMLSTWAGIRYMSPPIWMFVFINSGVHTIMYTYYTFIHMGIQVPRVLKSMLTAAQTTQIVFGLSYALAHLFIAYDIPVEVPYLFIHNLSSAFSTGVSSVSSLIASATASVDIGSWLKKAALRAAGEEGLAENVRNAQGQTFGIDAVHAAEVEKAQEEIRYKSQYQKVNCLDTPGQTLAIFLNFLYLAPLACMFVHLFYTKYIKQARSSSPPPTSENVRQSGKEAAKDLRQELEDAMASEQEGLETDKSDLPSEVANQSEKFNEKGEAVIKKAKIAASNATDRVKDGAHQANDIFQEKGQQATDALSDKINELNRKAKGSKGTPSESSKTNNTQATNGTKDANNESASTSKSAEDDVPKHDMDKAPKLEPKPSSTDNEKKSKSRSVSPQKRTQLPRPQSRNRQPSPEKNDETPKEGDHAPKEDNKPQVNGSVPSKGGSKDGRKQDEDDQEGKPSSLDESAYEVNPDELKDEGEKKAEAKMQPKSS
ncbi:MAG: hypothetical protein Q9213_006411 [Squamulea squamosa]